MTRGKQVTFLWQDTVLDTVHLPAGQTLARGPIDVHVDAERIERDGLVIRSRSVDAAERPQRVSTLDWGVARVFAISTLAHVFFVAAAWVTPPTRPFEFNGLARVRPDIKVYRTRSPDPRYKPLDLAGRIGAGRHRGDEGRFGPKAPLRDAAPSKKAGGGSDRDIAMSSGLLGALASGGALEGLLGAGGLGAGINEAMGGLRGTAMGDAGGAGGLGTRGHGPGGGGRSIGIGGIGIGPGRGRPGGANINLGGRGRHLHSPVRPGGRIILNDGLDKAAVGRVIRRNLARFRFCYERELNANPNLRGRVSLRFKILPTGSVASAGVQESSLDSAVVEGCVVRVMRTLKFPKPRGGGVVIVTYPFMMDAI